ncbi:T9SS type A sorting domain-containing protein [Aquimarina sp. ERC-38]|uniref:T9SS type A sorting domain-containing protein n=1 Tax=Aquimarina sp. ERC-38 TaxID=2949996 RepID=UPI002245ABEA|nr:T9SS type A sorting domain-containing protein [Aquimarina sp. ERC-38]UZO81528.1 T9SS type A sorting domain-containing protein [Aquimarina sp. ERC-38]
MKYFQFKTFIFSVLLMQFVCAQNFEQQAREKIARLQNLITTAEKANRDVIREKMTLRTAEVFLNYAKWDELNTEFNQKGFESLTTYRSIYNPNNDPLKDGRDSMGRDAKAAAENLPTFERKQIIMMVEKAIANVRALNKNILKRKPTINPDWSKISLDAKNARVVQTVNGKKRPIFVSSYNFMPDISIDPTGVSKKELDLTEYYGADNTFLIAGNTSSSPGVLNVAYKNSLIRANKSANFGNVFLQHRIVPFYLQEKYRNDKSDTSIYAGERSFTTYDIDNPDTRILWKTILNKASLDAKGKNFSGQGYLLANEPHFATAEGSYDNGAPSSADAEAACVADEFCNLNSVSKYTIDNFAVYLKDIHYTINNLNNKYGLKGVDRYASFRDVKIELPFKRSLIGTPIAYDWMRYNQFRVTNWFQFLKDNITKNDPEAKVHLKLIPGYLTDEIRDSGLNFEDLTRLSGISGNDAKVVKRRMRGAQSPLLEKYAYDWRLMSLPYDFFRSVKPNQVNYNSEVHYFATAQFRDLYLKPKYARSVTWLAHLLGQNMSEIWVWSRAKDGSVTAPRLGSHTGSLGQQPGIVNEIQLTMFELNAHAEDIYQIQLAKKPIRIFHSETSAINKIDHMVPISNLYEKLYFDGYPLGFVTKKIIQEQNNDNWKVILISESPFVTPGEFKALQTYLDNGGTIIMDDKSLKTGPYGNPLNKVLNTNKGGRIMKANSLGQFRNTAISVVNTSGLKPRLILNEDKPVNERGCFWRSIQTPDGRNVISINNLSKTSSKITIRLKGVPASNLTLTNMFTGEILSSNKIEIESEGVLFLDARSKRNSNRKELTLEENSGINIYPNPTSDFFKIEFNKQNVFLEKITMFDISGKIVFLKDVDNVSNLTVDTNMLQDGVYLLKLQDSSGEIDIRKVIVK